MPAPRTIASVILLGLLNGPALVAPTSAPLDLDLPSFVTPSLAADRRPAACLSKAEQRAAIAAHKAIPLAEAIRSVRTRGRRIDVVRAELCRRGGDLVYELTLLARNGKVTRAMVDAVSGQPSGPR